MKKHSNNFFLRLWRHPKGCTGIIIAMLLVFCAVFAAYIAPFDPYDHAETMRLMFETKRHDKTGPIFVTYAGEEYPW